MPYFSSIPTLNNPMTPALPVRLDRQNAGRLPAGYGTDRVPFSLCQSFPDLSSYNLIHERSTGK